MKDILKGALRTVGLDDAALALLGKKKPLQFENSQQYWNDRYKHDDWNSGAGSYGRLAKFKAEILNEFVVDAGVSDVIELGSGDGNQVALASYPKYTGFDISPEIVENCRAKFASDSTKKFHLMSDLGSNSADLAISLDVIYHLIEDRVFENYMTALFGAAKKHVVIYSSNSDHVEGSTEFDHVKHRRFTDWVDANCPQWSLAKTVGNRYAFDARDPNNTSFADFYFFDRKTL